MQNERNQKSSGERENARVVKQMLGAVHTKRHTENIESEN